MSSTNSWRNFAATLGSAPLAVVQVITHNADGSTSVVEFPGGSRTVVMGQSVAEGDYAFIQSGKIVGPAPAVAPATVDV